jgi:hypothetical protein
LWLTIVAGEGRGRTVRIVRPPFVTGRDDHRHSAAAAIIRPVFP